MVTALSLIKANKRTTSGDVGPILYEIYCKDALQGERNNKIGATDTGYRPGRSISWWNVNPMRTDESQKAIICCPYLTLILQTPTFTPNHTESLSNDNVFPVRCTECQREDILKSTSGTAWANAIWQERISLDMPDPEVCGLTAGWQLSLDRWAVCWSWRVDLARRSSEVVRYRYLWSGSYML